MRLEGPRLLGLCCFLSPVPSLDLNWTCIASKMFPRCEMMIFTKKKQNPYFATNLLWMCIKKSNRVLLHHCCYDDVFFFIFMKV